MKLLFQLGIYSILTYLLLDVSMKGGEKAARPLVQSVAGLSVAIVSIYNLRNIQLLVFEKNIMAFFKSWRFFSLMLVIYYILSFNEMPSSYSISLTREAVIIIYIFAVSLFFYYGVLNNHLSKTLLKLVVLVVILNGLFEVYYAFSFTKIKLGKEVINTSAGYIFLMILPVLIYLFKKDNIWVFIVTLILTMLTGKRGALLIYVFILFFSLFNYKAVKNSFSFNWKMVLFILVIILSYSFFLEYAYDSLIHRIVNIKNEQRGTIGSGRDLLWSTFLNHWYNGDALNIYLGFGFFSTVGINGFMAHNDFVEFLVDFGLFGLMVYLFFLGRFYTLVRKIKKIDNYLFYALFLCFIIWIGRAFIAGTIRTDHIILSISIGYLLGEYSVLLSKLKNSG